MLSWTTNSSAPYRCCTNATYEGSAVRDGDGNTEGLRSWELCGRPCHGNHFERCSVCCIEGVKSCHASDSLYVARRRNYWHYTSTRICMIHCYTESEGGDVGWGRELLVVTLMTRVRIAFPVPKKSAGLDTCGCWRWGSNDKADLTPVIVPILGDGAVSADRPSEPVSSLGMVGSKDAVVEPRIHCRCDIAPIDGDLSGK